MVKNKRVSLVMPVHNRWDLTKQCIDNILETKTPFDEFIIINNGSSDETFNPNNPIGGLLGYRQKDARFKLINNRQNVGVSKSWNMGVAATDCDYVCIINNDILVKKGWIDELVGTAIEFNRKVLIPQYTTRDIPKSFPTPPKENKKPGLIKRNLPHGIAKGVNFMGFCFLVDKRIFQQIGMFDERFEMWWYEDGDFLERLVQAKEEFKDETYLPTFATGAYIHHIESGTLNKMPDNIRMHFINQNRQRFEEKWHKKS